MPVYLGMGLSEEFIDGSCPYDLKPYEDAYKQQKEYEFKERNYNAYIAGAYVRDAIASTIGNMFSKKGHKPIEYPKEPYGEGEQPLRIHDNMTEKEKLKATEQLFANLKIMETNFNLNHKK